MERVICDITRGVMLRSPDIQQIITVDTTKRFLWKMIEQ